MFLNSAILCLALNIYHEARGEPIRGQVAVAQVTLNRVRSRRFPDSVCAVVYQPRQFSWTARPSKVTDREAFELALFIARHIDRFPDEVSGALYYYAPSKVSPRWAAKLTPVRQIGEHRFLKDD